MKAYDTQFTRRDSIKFAGAAAVWPRIFPNGTGQPNPKGV